MSRAQRFAFLGIAVVIAVVAVVLLTGGGDESSPPVRTSETPTATAESRDSDETATPTPTPTAEPPRLLTGGKVTRLEFKEGDTVRFRVRSDVPEEVHIHGYDIARDLEAGKTTTVSFKATIEGIFEIEFEHSGEQIAELRVEPR
jgi:FtsP/CotA-like multicopper oxidase with cupredoxin domain